MSSHTAKLKLFTSSKTAKITWRRPSYSNCRDTNFSLRSHALRNDHKRTFASL